MSAEWWDANLPQRMGEFEKWLTGPSDETRIPVRKIVIDAGYKTVLDCGCGLCADLDGFRQDGRQIDYTGIDSCQHLVDKAQPKCDGYARVWHADIEHLPFLDRSFDVVMCRGVLEHLKTWRAAMAEMVRVSKHEVLVSWFIPPTDVEKLTTSEENGGVVRHNWYARREIDDWIASRKLEWSWTPLPKGFELLRIRRVDA